MRVGRRPFFHVLLAGSPLLLVLAVALDRWRGGSLDSAGVGAQWQGQPERCLACHQREAEALSGAHDVRATGCSSCHLGNPASLDEKRAHAGLERFPGDFRSLKRTCGRDGCHADPASRVMDSLMGTARGLLAVDRFAFGEKATPDGEEGFGDLDPAGATMSQATAHARKLCASCHLGTSHLSPEVRTRGGGCVACHLQPGPRHDTHPQLALGVSPGACSGCHARSGRISLSYYGWHEGDAPDWLSSEKEELTRLDDGRDVRRTLPDVHAVAGLGCLDCHTSVGLMGDGRRYAHEEEQVDIQCTDCHLLPGAPLRASPLRDDEAAARRVAAYLDPGGAWSRGAAVVRTEHGTPLALLRVDPDGRLLLRPRAGGRDRVAKPTPADAAHQLAGHERLTCQACHSSWSHQCTACHTYRDSAGEQWDSVRGSMTAGKWIEESGDVRIDRPTLGVDAGNQIRPFVPGMPLCVGNAPRCRRYFAPADPHTTQREARPCESCHRNSLALGLGRGRLVRERGTWRFVAGPEPVDRAYTNPPWPDGAPWDAWTRLEQTADALSTRLGSHPLSPEELSRVLRVSACLKCHREYDDPIYQDFTGSWSRWRSGAASRCAEEVAGSAKNATP